MAKTVQEREEGKALRELRKENIRLRREVKQLRKLLARIDREEADSEEEFEVVVVTKNERPRPKCPKCGFSKDLYVFQLRNEDYYRCHNCDSKGKLNP